MADDTYTTLLEFVTKSDQSNREIKTTTENLKKMEEQAAKVSNVDLAKGLSFPGDELSQDFDTFTRAFDKTFKRVKDNIVDLRTGTKAVSADLRKFSGTATEDLKKINLGDIDIEKIKEAARKAGQEISNELAAGLASGNLTEADYIEIDAIEKQIEEVQKLEQAREQELKTAIRASRLKSSLLNREAQILNKMAADIKQNADILRNQAQQLQGISQLALGVGTGVVGGIFAFATKYVRDAKEATVVTAAWRKEQEGIAASGQRVGAVLAKEALPLLRLAADAAEKASLFIEKHPEIVRAALNTGVVLAGLGAVGLAVSKGIKLYADQLYLSSIPLQLEAGRLQFAAAQEQLLAARIKAGAVAGDAAVPGGGGAGGAAVPSVLSSIIAPIALIVAGLVAAKFTVDIVNMVLEKTGAAKAIADAQKKILETSSRPYPGIITGARPNAGASAEVTTGTPLGVQASNQFQQILNAYEQYKKDDLALVKSHYAQRENIVSSALQAEQAANARFATESSRIRTQTGHAISQATAAFHQQETQAEQAFAIQRAQTIRDGGIEIQRIEEQLQENLRKMKSDHEDRLVELVASRDALGIVKEQERYNKERAEAIQSTNAEIRQRRADLAIRLADQFQAYQNERTQRLAEFQARLGEINANAQQQLKELAARHQEELSQIRQQRNERIKELDNQFKEERKRRYEYFVDQIRQLDAGLLGEAELRKRRQAELIAELDRFLLQYNQKAGSIAQASALSTVRAKGGYATYGTYLLGDRQGGGPGKREYVLSGDTTELAERVLGGQLSQNKLAAFLSAMGGGSRNNVVYNDSRQISSDISNATREKIVDDTFSALTAALSG